MELDPPEVTAANSTSQPENQPITTNHTTTNPTPERATRSSARVRAAKEKERLTQESTISITETPATRKGSSRRTDKVKAKETDNAPISTRTRGSAVVINEPIRDPKGKRRAPPEPDSDEELPSTSNKRPKTAASSRRSKKSTDTTPVKTKMTKKTKATTKSKATKANVAGSSATHDDEDIEMFDGDHRSERDEGDDVHADAPMDDDDDDEGDLGEGGASGGGPPGGGLDEATLALFGADYRALGNFMLSLSSRLKTILTNIKPKADPTTRMIALQELSEILSMSTEDTLSGYFDVDAFVKELVTIMGGPKAQEGDGDEGDEDEDAALAAALAMSAGGVLGDPNVESQVLACRCLANLMEAIPGCAHTVVYHGAVPVLCSKLLEIQYIDLAEQTLSTLEKISEEYPSAIVREGGLSALLNFLDFFSTNIQRTALQAASNCCRNASADNFNMIRDVFPIIRTVLGYSDQRLVEYACLCVTRTIDSFHRSSPELLETLLDTELIRAINILLLPAGGSPTIPPNTYALLLHALAIAAKASPKTGVALLEADISSTLYQILTGLMPPTLPDELGDGSQGQSSSGGVADMAVLQNLAHRPKEQVEEALNLITELMPPLPKDGVFEHRAYTDKALSRLMKAKAKADRAAARVAAGGASTPALTPAGDDAAAAADGGSQSQTAEASDVAPPPSKEPVLSRTELLRQNPEVVGKFIRSMVPVLVDVYSASVALTIRTKTMAGILKAVSFVDADELANALKNVPVAGFASSVLSLRDHPTLVIGGLQFIELLLVKVPSEFKPSLRREGVLHEIEKLADQPVTPPPPKQKSEPPATDDSASPTPSVTSAPVPIIPTISSLKRSSSSIDPQDMITLRSRILRFKYLIGSVDSEGDHVFQSLQSIVSQISDPQASEITLRECLVQVADHFASPQSSVSSFELIKSGLVDGLLQFATDSNRTVDTARRQQLLLETLSKRGSTDVLSHSAQTPLGILVKKLQESLTRMESFEVVTVSPGIEDSKRGSASMLARQLRLRLTAAEGSDIPPNCANIIVSIHAIATFQALNDYLRPRISIPLGSSSRLSAILASLAKHSSGATPGASAAGSSSAAPPPAPEVLGNDAVGSSATVKSDGRRRSLRLSAKATGSNTISETPKTQDGASTTAEDPPISETVHEHEDDDIHDDFIDDDFDAEVLEDMEREPPAAEKTVTVAVAEDGVKMEAKTPDGTRVATPNPLKESVLATTGSPVPKASYAAALKAKPTDWHLEFSMDDDVLPLNMTIYGAVHQHELRRNGGPAAHPNAIWSGIYNVKFKKVNGPPPSDSRADPAHERPATPSLPSLPHDSPTSQILRLLRVLQKLNVRSSEGLSFDHAIPSLPESAFVNNRLTAKLTRQLEEPMIVASSCLPDWALDLPQHFPFLFPFSTRYSFLQSTSFGYARLILKWQLQQNQSRDTSRRDDGFGFLGRLQRQKVRISRKHILESAIKVFDLYGSSSSVLEVEYFEEVGTGLGPTLEFYSLVSREFARRDLKMWRDADTTVPGLYVHHPTGLFPAPLSETEAAKESGRRRCQIFSVMGQFVAKALLDSRIIDVSFSKIFMKLILGEDVPLTISSLKVVDPALAKSLSQFQALVDMKQNIDRDPLMSAEDKRTAISRLTVNGVSLEDLSLDFTVPGYDIELRPGGREQTVDAQNLEEYIHAVIDTLIGKGVQAQAQAFRDGFSKVFPISDLQSFSSDELVMLFGNADEDWSIETLSDALKADHGFNSESRAIRDLVEIMSEYDGPTRREYLQFITGSPKLPIGGFRGLTPPLTVVRKPHEAPLVANDYLPSVMTCVNYLKLPEYSSKEVMREKLRIAMKEGVGSFHLS